MPSLNLVSSRLADAAPTGAMLEYVVAGNGLFVCAEDDRLMACVPVAPAFCQGLPPVAAVARLKLPRIPAAYLTAIWRSALRHLPNEAAYQFIYDAPLPWRVFCPIQTATRTGVEFQDDPAAVVDLHSHGALPAFFSDTDNGDEGGLRFYVVIGNLGATHSYLRARVGVYGHHWDVPAVTLFDGLGPFTDMFNQEIDL
jgi:PRTRC genetic system protein A